MSKRRYILYRTVQSIVLLWALLTFLFFFFRLLPGDYTDLMLFGGASPAEVQAFRAQWGLNDPLHSQYLRYITNFAQFDFGTSLASRKPVWEAVRMNLFHSFILVAPAMIASYVLGSLIGTVLGMLRGTAWERRGLVPFVFLGSMPSFFVGIILIAIFSRWLGLLPPNGMFSTQTITLYADSAWWRPYLTGDFLLHYILPFTAIVIRYLYFALLVMRTSVVEVLNEDFMFFHRIVGLPSRARMKHFAKHASLPVITVFPISLAQAMSGLVLIEVVFNWPGMGYALVQAVLGRNFPVIQFIFFVIGAFVIVSNFVIDILYSVIDPRIDLEE